MVLIGFDFHPSWQQVSWINRATGETGDQKLLHEPGAVEKFYRQFPAGARIGMEATGNCQWFLELMAKLGHEVWRGTRLKGTDEPMLRQLVSADEEEKSRLRSEKVRAQFDDKRGDKWCPDDVLYKRAARIDAAVSQQVGEKRSDLLWLVNTIWHYASEYTHGMARPLSDHFEEKEETVVI
jgi:hypothetical protein